MKAVYFERHGGPEVLIYGDVPDPSAGPGEVVVNIAASSVNGADWKVRAGNYYTETPLPHILGRDFSGTVAAVGDGVPDLHAGDAVFGVLPAGQEGTYAEQVAVAAAVIARKPADMPHVDAAALALTGLTAMSAIEETIQLKRGETILIQGGSGGVAGVAIQLARHIGARVITTTSAANIEYVRDLGADQVIDYHAEDFTSIGPVCDAVFDTVGGDVAQKSYTVLKPGGRAAFIASGRDAPPAARSDVQTLRPPATRARAPLERLAQLYQAGAVRPPELRLFKLSDAAEAHRVSEGRHLRGKLIFQIRDAR